MILDAGSGMASNPRANILMDKYLQGDSTSRITGTLMIRKGQTMICGDLEAMPFLDKSFDIVICSQTLEHVDNPEKACAELVRVGRSGFITAPNETVERRRYERREKLYHKWLIKQRGTHLDFYLRSLVPSLPMMEHPSQGVDMAWKGSFTWSVFRESP